MKGAIGLMQLMPDTWTEVRAKLGLGYDPDHPADNIMAGAYCLRLMYDRFGYDSPTGQVLLIPQGARLIGKYDSVVAYGQDRALVVWQRLMMPDGSSLLLDNMPATDAAGYGGLCASI